MTGAVALLLAAALPLADDQPSTAPVTVSSPDGAVRISFLLSPATASEPRAPRYRIDYHGRPVLVDSPLGLDFVGAEPLDRKLAIERVSRSSHDSTWGNAFGALRRVPDSYNELTVLLVERQPPRRKVALVFRAYNEGAAFRYMLPRQDALPSFTISAEETGFRFARATHGWTLNMGRFNTHNESEYTRARLNEIEPTAIINLPLLMEMEGGPWAALLEAELTNYPGLYVGGVARAGDALVAKLSVPPSRKAEEAVVGATPFETPWRVLMLASTPARLIEQNYLTLNLSRPVAIGDVSWIRPGKSAWDWWSGSFAKNVSFTPGMNTATMKHYVDFAAAHHLEFMLIDAGWYNESTDRVQGDLLHPLPEVDVPGIVQYARAKGVQVLLWVEWRSLDRQLDEATSLFERWGVAGIKVDYMNRDDQEMVTLYEKWVRKAAEHHLTVDFHGAYKPTGLQRTYPNLLTREGVMGMEYNKWSERVTPEHNVTIPFTRMLAGPMDFTPGGFRNAARGKFQIRDIEPMTQGTRAHQLAMYVVYESPLVMVSDYPEAYDGQPGIEFIEKVPVVWDETRVLQGTPGKFVAIARRHDSAWYLGAMTNWDARELTLPLDFLGSGSFEMTLFADGPNADTDGTSLAVTTRRVTAGDTLKLHLAGGGGAAVILSPAK